MKASDLSAKEVTETIKSLTVKTLKLFGVSALSSHSDWTNGHCEVEVKLPKTLDSLKAAHQTIAFYKDSRYDMSKQLSL